MFEARLMNGIIFKQIIDAFKDLVENGNIDCSEEEIAMQCMDAAHVSLVAMSLNAAAFDHYRCDKKLSLGFNSENLSRILKMMGKNDILNIKAEDDGDSLTFLYENEKNDTIADFELKLMDITTEALALPDTPYKATVKMNSGEFQRIIRDMQVLGDTCTISINKEGIRFTVVGAIGTGNILIRQNNTAEKEENQVIIDMEEPVELSFALRYLNNFTKATPLTSQVIVCLNPDVPMVVEYPIQEIGFIKFYLAPKIDDDEEEEE